MDWHTLTPDQALKRLGSNDKNGLSQHEANLRLEKYGPNVLSSKKKRGFFKKFISQFSDFMVLILLAASVISFITSYFSGDGDYIDSIIILVIVFLNALIGTIQESRAEKAIAALRKLSAPRARVVRSGSVISAAASELVTGDIIILKSGDLVPADCLIIECSSLKAEESALTGESEPAAKSAGESLSADTPLGERRNMLFSATQITSGSCRAVVTATAMDTAVGHIAGLIDSEETPSTPLQNRLAKTGKLLGIGALAICAVIFVMGILRNANFLDSFMLSVSLAVAAIPEGLPAVVTIVLSLGVQIMAKNNAIIRRLPAVETLGSATVICSDKTGTLTENKMTVKGIYGIDGEEKFSSPLGKRLLTCACVCNNALWGKESIMGEPTEAAILNAGEKSGIKKPKIDKEYIRLRENPFSSDRKMMSVLVNRDSHKFVMAKGAPDVLIKKCTKILKNGTEVPITAADIKKIEEINLTLAEKALRVIAAAERTAASLDDTSETSLTFIGLIAMADPPRKEAKEAVAMCRRAGIKTVMITGDHAATAKAVAAETGILRKGDTLMTGSEIDALSDELLRKKIKTCRVFARVTPAHKVRIVKALRSLGEVVAMTGDGVNDAPALKAADIGCAMGQGGTDAAKAAADMILTDDNFATIVKAVRQGRIIYSNIRKTVHFLLSSNIGEIVVIFAAYILGMPTPLLPIQLLFVNLITDSLPAMALGTEKAERDIMLQKPLKTHKSMFSGGLWVDIFLEGLLIGGLSLVSFTVGMRMFDFSSQPLIGRTMAFVTLNISELVHAFNMRGHIPMYKIGYFSNMRLTMTFIICMAIQWAVVTIPSAAAIFSLAPLSGTAWFIALALSAVPFIIIETIKIFDFYRKPAKEQ